MRMLLLMLAVGAGLFAADAAGTGSAAPAARQPTWTWAIQGGGTGSDHGVLVAMDPAGGTMTVQGRVNAAATFGPSHFGLTESSAVFHAQATSRGEWLRAEILRSGSHEYVTAVGPSGAIATGMTFKGSMSASGTRHDSKGVTDILVSLGRPGKNGGYAPAWSASGGGSGRDAVFDIAVDDRDNVYLVGSFDTKATFGDFTVEPEKFNDWLVAKLGPTGSWEWVATSRGSGTNRCLGLGLDPDGSLYVVGFSHGAISFGPHEFDGREGDDGFVAKVAPDGTWAWVRRIDSPGVSSVTGVALDRNGNLVLAGQFFGTIRLGPQELTSAGSADIWVAAMAPDGAFLWAVGAGGPEFDGARGLTLDGKGTAYVTGYFGGTADFGGHTLTTASSSDVFLAAVALP